MSIRQRAGNLRTWIPIILASAILAAGSAYFLSGLLPKTYEAKATVIVGQSLSDANPELSQLLASQRLSATYAAIAVTRPLLEAAIEKVGLTVNAEELAKHVKATAPLESTLLVITAEDSDPGRAAAIANELALQLVTTSGTLQGRDEEVRASVDKDLQATQEQITETQAEVETLRDNPRRTEVQEARLVRLQGDLVDLRSTYASLLPFSSGNATNLVTLVDPAVAGALPVSPRPLLNAALAGLLGLIFATSVIGVAQFFDDRMKDAEAVQTAAGLPTLGTITRIRGRAGRQEIYRLVTLLFPRSAASEAYRTLRTNVEFAAIDDKLGVLLVTSAVPGEGKTVTAANLAVAFAQSGRRVLLVDADLRKPGVDQIFNVPNERGLTSMLRGEDPMGGSFAQATEQPNLQVLTTGPLPPNPAELLASKRMRTVLERLQTGYDLMIVDGPPLLVVTDAAILSAFLDATILVVDAERSRRNRVHEARETLAKAGARVFGRRAQSDPGPDAAGRSWLLRRYNETATGREATTRNGGFTGVSTQTVGHAPEPPCLVGTRRRLS